MIKEVAFVAIAVSDKERARKFYQETLELKPSANPTGRRMGRVRSWRNHNRCWLSSGVETVTRRNDDRF